MKSNHSADRNAIRDEEFRSFHKIDRILFAHLILTLKLAVKDAIHFMAFWLWLERDVVEKLDLVKRLVDSQPQLVQDLADETLACLRCITSDVFPLPSLGDPINLRQFVNRNITLKYLHQNREQARMGISKMLNQVCYRAFDDLLRDLPSGSRGGGIEVYDAYSGSAAGYQQAAGAGFPANPWQQQQAGAGFPANPWQQPELAAEAGFLANPWQQQEPAAGAGFPENPWQQHQVAGAGFLTNPWQQQQGPAGAGFPANPWQQQEAAGAGFPANSWQQQQAAGAGFPANPWQQPAAGGDKF